MMTRWHYLYSIPGGRGWDASGTDMTALLGGEIYKYRWWEMGDRLQKICEWVHFFIHLRLLMCFFSQSLLSTSECGGPSARHGKVPGPNAASSASRTVLAKTNCMRARTSFGTSCSTSFLFAHGRITLLAPARCAPSTFSLIPPTGETRPRSVI